MWLTTVRFGIFVFPAHLRHNRLSACCVTVIPGKLRQQRMKTDRTPGNASWAFLNCGVATEGSVVSHIEKRPLIALGDSRLRSILLFRRQVIG